MFVVIMQQKHDERPSLFHNDNEKHARG